MVRWQTFGASTFTGLPGAVADRLEAHPKRLALLAYVLLSARGGRVSRESAIGMLWPDRPPARARGSLRNAVHVLRRHIGHGAIASRADDLLVDPGQLSCDALEFTRLLTAAEPGEAFALYSGDLLPGLEVAGPPGFERWLESERERYRTLAAGAAWRLAESAEEDGNWVTAVDLARRGVALSLDSERALRRLMRLLDRAGDRVAALTEYERHAVRWTNERRVEPSPETRALADAIRRGPALEDRVAGASVRSGDHGATGDPRAHRPESRPATQRTLVVLPFLRTGSEAAHEHLASGLAQGIVGSLSRLASLRVIARTAGGSSGVPGRLPPGRHASGIRDEETLLQGSLGIKGDRMVLAAQLVDAATGAPVWADIQEIEGSELLDAQTRLTMAILEALKVEPTAAEKERLLRRPTEDPVAYELYLTGRSHLNRRSAEGLEVAIRSFEEALARDPGFGLAFAGLADSYMLLWPIAGVRMSEARVRAREAARQALKADPRLGEVHATLGMLRAVMERDWYGAEADFRRAIELNPGHATAHHWYGAYLVFAPRRFDDGCAELELARQLDPLSPIIRVDTGLAWLHRGDPHGAVARFREALELDSGFWRAHHDMGVALVLAGDPEGGVEHLERAWRLRRSATDPERAIPPDDISVDWRTRLERRLEHLASTNPTRGNPGFEAALVLALLGRPKEALDRLRVANDEGSWGLVMQYMPAFTRLGVSAELRALLEEAGLRPELGAAQGFSSANT